MTAFYFGAAALLLAACAFVLWPLLRARRRATLADSNSASNLAVLREQRDLLDADLAAARIDAAQHLAARAELERRVLEEDADADADADAEADAEASAGAGAGKNADATGASSKTAPRSGRPTALAVALGLAVPLLAIGLYARLGNTAGLAPQAAAQPAVSEADVIAMVDKLAQRMQAQPDDAKGWLMLGRAYAAMQRFPDSAKAYARAVALTPNDAQLLVDYADVLAAVAQSAAGEPTRLITRALQIEPGNLKGLALAGSAAFERKDFPAAIAYWTQARAAAPVGGEFAQGLDSSLAEARAAAGPSGTVPPAQANATTATNTATNTATSAATATATEPATAAVAVAAAAPSAAGTAASPNAAAAEQLAGRVSLTPALAARVAADDTLFIYARAAEGPRMPLAILRRKAGDLPLTFTLDDSMAMAPQMKLSKFGSVIVEARISKSGDAITRAGDLRGQLGPLKPGSAGLVLVIDSVVP